MAEAGFRVGVRDREELLAGDKREEHPQSIAAFLCGRRGAQVNCPGCFTSALPTLFELHSDLADRRDDIAVFAVATAFEDFDLNTEASLRALLRDGTISGATLSHLQEWQGKERYDLPLPFPVGWDRVEPSPRAPDAVWAKAEAMLDALLRRGRLDTGGAGLDEARRRAMVERLADVVRSRPYGAKTFDANALRGTPSWVVFREDGSIVDEWLGPQRSSASIAAMARATFDE